jgi:2-keto-3-deoxy-L-rhamnonate aldolase RhmA/quercetin dioxygenase-like cupin family protein
MKTAALKKFRSRLQQQQSVVGLWVTLESASLTEMAVALGVDWVVVDAEHGHLDWKEINEHIRAALRSDTVVLVRLAERSTALTKRALDIGADGVVIPWIETAEQLAEAVQDCRYPPAGRRGIGGERATAWGQCMAEHTAEANEQVLVVPILESIRAVPHIQQLAAVDGVDVFFFGPADFSASAGFRGQWEGPGIAQQILQLKDVLLQAGRHCGLLTTSTENLLQRQAQGFRMLGLGTDSGLLLRSLHQTLATVGRDCLPAASLDARDSRPLQTVLTTRPAEMLPDRAAVIADPAAGFDLELQAGVGVRPLVGAHNSARRLTTSLVTLQPAASLDYHTHPFSESITVLSGQLEMLVEGRVYKLGPLDNITIPRWLPHAAHNPDSSTPARLHTAMASDTPARTLVSQSFTEVEMPADSTGLPGAERVTRIRTAVRVQGVGPNAACIDHFNADLLPGLEMSGGYAWFLPGGRLPAHLHDFDESICIIEGQATCLVEGQSHQLQNCQTAMVPRGRVHYFRNDSDMPMAMLWVYAGPRPERILVEERLAVTAGSESGPAT